MSGETEFIPEKNRTPNITMSISEINLLFVFLIFLRFSFIYAIFILQVLTFLLFLSTQKGNINILFMIFYISFVLYHSISSIDCGFLFIIISSAFPFLKRITLSAIGAIALLCVIIITVIFSFLHVSCSNFSICFPVL